MYPFSCRAPDGESSEEWGAHGWVRSLNPLFFDRCNSLHRPQVRGRPARGLAVLARPREDLDRPACAATSTSFWAIRRAFLSATPTATRAVCYNKLRAGVGADWCLESDVVTNLGASGPQQPPQRVPAGLAARPGPVPVPRDDVVLGGLWPEQRALPGRCALPRRARLQRYKGLQL